jgi:hypothetical protein
MLVLRHPMRVALALTATMLSLAGVYALLGVHAIAVFQVLIYVGAVMVFMVYAIMLLDVRDRSFTRRFSLAAAARNRRCAPVPRDPCAQLVARAARAHRRGGTARASAYSISRPNS